MNLLKRLKRYKVKKLHVCAIFRADNLQHKPYLGYMIGEFDTTWTANLLGLKILFGDIGEVLKDPTEKTEYIPSDDLRGFYPDKNLYYEEKIVFSFTPEEIAKRSKISLAKIEELNSVLNEELNKRL